MFFKFGISEIGYPFTAVSESPCVILVFVYFTYCYISIPLTELSISGLFWDGPLIFLLWLCEELNR